MKAKKGSFCAYFFMLVTDFARYHRANALLPFKKLHFSLESRLWLQNVSLRKREGSYSLATKDKNLLTYALYCR